MRTASKCSPVILPTYKFAVYQRIVGGLQYPHWQDWIFLSPSTCCVNIFIRQPPLDSGLSDFYDSSSILVIWAFTFYGHQLLLLALFSMLIVLKIESPPVILLFSLTLIWYLCKEAKSCITKVLRQSTRLTDATIELMCGYNQCYKNCAFHVRKAQYCGVTI
jgi:hypothetical protein